MMQALKPEYVMVELCECRLEYLNKQFAEPEEVAEKEAKLKPQPAQPGAQLDTQQQTTPVYASGQR